MMENHNWRLTAFLFLITAFLAVTLCGVLKTGVAKGRGGLQFDRDEQPILYWVSVFIHASGCAFFAFLAFRSLP